MKKQSVFFCLVIIMVLSLCFLANASVKTDYAGIWNGNVKNNVGGNSLHATMTMYEDLEGELDVNGTVRSFQAQTSGSKLSFYLNKPNVQGCYSYRVGCNGTLSRDRKTLMLQCGGTVCGGKKMNWKGVFTR